MPKNTQLARGKVRVQTQAFLTLLLQYLDLHRDRLKALRTLILLSIPPYSALDLAMIIYSLLDNEHAEVTVSSAVSKMITLLSQVLQKQTLSRGYLC